MKSLHKRCIRRWKVYFKKECDSKHSQYWCKHDLKGFIRDQAINMADSMIEEIAELNARHDYGINGWSPEFSSWYDEKRDKYIQEALGRQHRRRRGNGG